MARAPSPASSRPTTSAESSPTSSTPTSRARSARRSPASSREPDGGTGRRRRPRHARLRPRARRRLRRGRPRQGVDVVDDRARLAPTCSTTPAARSTCPGAMFTASHNPAAVQRHQAVPRRRRARSARTPASPRSATCAERSWTTASRRADRPDAGTRHRARPARRLRRLPARARRPRPGSGRSRSSSTPATAWAATPCPPCSATQACPAAARDRAALLRAGRHLPQPRGQPARAGEPRRPAGRGRRARRRPGPGLRRRRRPLLRRRRARRAGEPVRDHRAGRRARSRELAEGTPASAVIHNLITRGPCPRSSPSTAARRCAPASATRSSRPRWPGPTRSSAASTRAHYYFRDFWFADTGMLAAHARARRARRAGRAAAASWPSTSATSPPARSTRRSPTRRPATERGARRRAPHGRRGRRARRPHRDPRWRRRARCGGSTCARPTPSRCCGSTSRPPTPPRWPRCATRCSRSSAPDRRVHRIPDAAQASDAAPSIPDAVPRHVRLLPPPTSCALRTVLTRPVPREPCVSRTRSAGWRRCIRALGSEVTVVELMDQLMPGADPDLVKPLADAPEEAGRRRAPEDQGRRERRRRRTASRVTFEGASMPERTTLRPRAGRGRPQRRTAASSTPTRPACNVTERGFIAVDRADAHQRAAHLRHRRPGREADAGAQGHARRPARRGSRRRR